MTPADAAKLLELPADATPDQIEARFHELRTKLEEKIGKAPTPGLKAKYRESLDEITAAFETLALAADSSSLPVLNKQSAVSSQPSARAGTGTAVAAAPSAPEAGNRKSRIENQKSGREFLVVAVIAVAVLAAGGWWVVKTRAENAEKARIAAELKAEAEAKAAADKAEQARKAEEARLAAEAKRKAEEEEKARQAAAAKAEQERRDKALALLRSRMAQLNVQAAAIFGDEPTRAARRLAELKAEERSLSREKEGPELVKLRAQLDAQQGYVDELEALLNRHPAKSTQAQATELLSARELDTATEAVDLLTSQLAKLDTLTTEARQKLDGAIYGTLQVENTAPEAQWVFRDAFGVETRGGESQVIHDVGIGSGLIEFSRPGWPKQSRTVAIRRGTQATVASDFRPARLAIRGRPEGARFTLSDGQQGRVPAEIEVIPGAYKVSLAAPGHYALQQDIQLGIGESRTVEMALKEEPLWTEEEARNLASGLSNWVGTSLPYHATIYSLAPDASIVAVVSSAMPLSMVAAPYPKPDAKQLVPQGGSVPVYFGTWKRNAFASTGTRAANPAFAPVDQALRENCGGVVHMIGVMDSGNGRWINEPSVFATSNPALAPAAQQWIQSIRMNRTAPAPSDAYFQYRVFIAVRFLAPIPAN